MLYYERFANQTVKHTNVYKVTLLEKEGKWAVYYTSPQSFILTISYSLAQKIWGL